MNDFSKYAANSRGNRETSTQVQQVDSPDTLLPFRKTEIERSIPERFERAVGHFSNRLAVKTAVQTLTYKELDRVSNQVAHAILKQCGEGAEPIAILLEHGAAPIVAILGVLKTSKFYVALYPSSPHSKLIDILEDTKAGLIVTHSKHLHLAAELAGNKRQLLDTDQLDNRFSNKKVNVSVSPDSLAVIFYTSGSTGRPKGVKQNHRNLLHTAWRNINDCRICTEDHVSLLAFCGFAASSADLYGTLLSGSILCPFNARKAGINELIDWLIHEKITVFHPSVMLFRQFLYSLTGDENFPNLRLIILSGQTISKQDVQHFKKYLPGGCNLVFRMGLTETGSLTRFQIDQKTEIRGNTVPVGYTTVDKEIFLIDSKGQEVDFNSKGEIAVRSRYLVPGYWRNNELTRKKFLSDPDGGDKRIFLTGDLGRMRSDGYLEHCGRKDFQVKIRGYRIEMTEIEAALYALNCFKDVVVVARDNQAGDKYLTAYLVPSASHTPNVSELRRVLAETLHEYMIPSAFYILEKLPLLPSGKVDRQALPEPDRTRPELDTNFVYPRDTLEFLLTHIWMQVLDIRPIGVRDNFFDIGGDSILAIQLFYRIEKAAGRTLPVTTLLHAPTIEKLAKILIHEGWSPPWVSLVPIQPGGSIPPLFYVPPAAMTILGTDGLVKYLGQGQPFYGLQPRGIDNNDISPHTRVEEMAAYYISEIRQIQPEGPYFLVGRCFGGLVAFEMAQQLREYGQSVALLVILDTIRPPGFYHKLQQNMNRHTRRLTPLRHVFRRLVFYWTTQPKQLPRALLRKTKNFLGWPVLLRMFIKPHERLVQRVNYAHYNARLAYIPRVYPGKITCFWPDETENKTRSESRLGWKELTSEELEIHIVPGDHRSMMKEPHIRVLAEKFKECLKKARENL